jgi:hypothetical protein
MSSTPGVALTPSAPSVAHNTHMTDEFARVYEFTAHRIMAPVPPRPRRNRRTQPLASHRGPHVDIVECTVELPGAAPDGAGAIAGRQWLEQ